MRGFAPCRFQSTWKLHWSFRLPKCLTETPSLPGMHIIVSPIVIIKKLIMFTMMMNIVHKCQKLHYTEQIRHYQWDKIHWTHYGVYPMDMLDLQR